MITRVPLHIREGLGSHKLHYTGGELGPNTLQVAQWLEHPTRSLKVLGSNPIWDSDFFLSSPYLYACINVKPEGDFLHGGMRPSPTRPDFRFVNGQCHF